MELFDNLLPLPHNKEEGTKYKEVLKDCFEELYRLRENIPKREDIDFSLHLVQYALANLDGWVRARMAGYESTQRDEDIFIMVFFAINMIDSLKAEEVEDAGLSV